MTTDWAEVNQTDGTCERCAHTIPAGELKHIGHDNVCLPCFERVFGTEAKRAARESAYRCCCSYPHGPHTIKCLLMNPVNPPEPPECGECGRVYSSPEAAHRCCNG